MTPDLEIAARRLTEVGLPPHVTAGIVANLAHESDGNPKAIGDEGTSIGLAQWHDERANALLDYAAKSGRSVKDPLTQTDFLLHELSGDQETLQALAATTSPGQAADVFQRRFEKPKVIDPERSASAAAAFQWMLRKDIIQPKNFVDRVKMERGGKINGGDVAVDVGPNALGVAPALGKIAQTAAAFERAGVDPSIAQVVPSVFGRTATKIAETLPGGGFVSSPLAKAGEQAEQALHRAATSLGPVGNAESAGQAAQAGISAFKGRFSAEAERLYMTVSEHMPRDMPVILNKAMSTLADLRAKFPSNPLLGDLLTPQSYDKLSTALKSTGGKLTWQEAQALRSDVGAKLGAPQLLGDASHGQLKQLYGALSDDLAAAAEAVGGQAAAAWRGANEFYKSGSQMIERSLSAIWDATPAQAFDKIVAAARMGSRADLRKLRELADAVGPTGMGEISATMLRGIAQPRPGSATALAGGEFSPRTLVTEFGKFTPQAKDLLFGKIGTASRDGLEDVLTVARQQAALEGAGNASGTARWANTAGLGGGAVALGADPMTVAGTAAGGLLAGRAMTSPVIGRLLKNVPARQEILFRGAWGALNASERSAEVKQYLRDAGAAVAEQVKLSGYTPTLDQGVLAGILGPKPTREERDLFRFESGKLFVHYSTDLLGDERFAMMSPEDQQKELAKVNNRAQKDAAMNVKTRRYTETKPKVKRENREVLSIR